jgi:hypothetical protein
MYVYDFIWTLFIYIWVRTNKLKFYVSQLSVFFFFNIRGLITHLTCEKIELHTEIFEN